MHFLECCESIFVGVDGLEGSVKASLVLAKARNLRNWFTLQLKSVFGVTLLLTHPRSGSFRELVSVVGPPLSL